MEMDGIGATIWEDAKQVLEGFSIRKHRGNVPHILSGRSPHTWMYLDPRGVYRVSPTLYSILKSSLVTNH